MYNNMMFQTMNDFQRMFEENRNAEFVEMQRLEEQERRRREEKVSLALALALTSILR